jgi:hypothetical protein
MSEGIFLLMFSIICFLVAAFMRNRERLNALEKFNKLQKIEKSTEAFNEPGQ